MPRSHFSMRKNFFFFFLFLKMTVFSFQIASHVRHLPPPPPLHVVLNVIMGTLKNMDDKMDLIMKKISEKN
jgi:hypothetical protein